MIKKNVAIVLKRRGYTVYPKEDNEDENIGFVIPFLNGTKRGKVVYSIKEKINIDDLSDIFSPIIENPIHIIVIYKKITNPCLKSFNENISKYLPDCELIDEMFFIRDIMSHPLVSEYKLVTKDEKPKILLQYRAKEEHFPQMLVSDPISIIMGFKNGDMCKIISWYNFTKKCVDKEMPPLVSYSMVTDKQE